MASLNKATIIGNLGRDPEVRFTADGKPIANFSIATTDKWKDKSTGEQKEATEWHRCVAYDRLAEIVQQYVKKGSSIYVEGSLKTRKWSDKDGIERYTTEITVQSLQLLGGQQSGGQGVAPAPRTAAPAPRAKPAPASTAMDDDSEIPF